MTRDDLRLAVQRALQEAVADDYNPGAVAIINNRSDILAAAVIPLIVEECAKIADEKARLWGASGSAAIEAADAMRRIYGSHEA